MRLFKIMRLIATCAY